MLALKRWQPFGMRIRKKKDKKHLGKKARLRQWRKETFGDEQGSRKSFPELLAEQLSANSHVVSKDMDAEKEKGDRGKKRKRSRKNQEAVPVSGSISTVI